MKPFVVGLGDVGLAVCKGFGVTTWHDAYDPATPGRCPKEDAESQHDILLVCFPYFEGFQEAVRGYMRTHSCKAAVIFSTVPVGTTRGIPGAVHSPVEGRHSGLAAAIKNNPRLVGGYNPTAHRFFAERGVAVNWLPKPEFTEFLKLRSTARYGAAIEFARYEKSVCDELGMDYEAVREYDRWYNDIYALDPNVQRYILTPPEGDIGGHCVVPNAKLLDDQFPSIFLREIYRPKEAPCSQVQR